jgi:hypothetical protein
MVNNRDVTNVVASCVAELDDTLPPYGCYMG